MQPGKLLGCDLVLNPQLETTRAEKSMLGLFPQSIWHYLMTLPSTCINSSTARHWLAWGDDTRACPAGDLGSSNFCRISGWAPVPSGMPRIHLESLEACPPELVWKVAGSSSHLMSRAPLCHRWWVGPACIRAVPLKERSLTGIIVAVTWVLVEMQIVGSTPHIRARIPAVGPEHLNFLPLTRWLECENHCIWALSGIMNSLLHEAAFPLLDNSD